MQPMKILKISYKYTQDIFDKIKNYINSEIGIKENGYFISDYEINKNNESFFPVIQSSKEVAKKLDDDSYIDKIFDNIMINFENNITEIIIGMEKYKEQKFDMQENILKYSSFSDTEKDKLKDQITNIKVKIHTDIKNENDYYMGEIKKNIKTFKENEIKKLNDLILDLDVFLSEEKLNNFDKNFKVLYYSIIDKISKEIIKNEQLSNQYFNEYIKAISDNNYLQDLLYGTDVVPSKAYVAGKWRGYIRVDYQKITSKEKTSGYLSKYNSYKAN